MTTEEDKQKELIKARKPSTKKELTIKAKKALKEREQRGGQ